MALLMQRVGNLLISTTCTLPVIHMFCTYVDALYVYMMMQGSIDNRIDMLCRRALGLDMDSTLEVCITNYTVFQQSSIAK
jgi:hypothetical protein